MVLIPTIARNVVRSAPGYWVARSEVPVSYPEDGHDACFAVEDGSFWFRHRTQVIVAAVRRLPPAAAGPLLDVGGGNGYVSRGLEDAGFRTVLVEPGATGAANALRRGLRDVVCSTVEAAGFRDGSFGGFGLFDVLEHIADDAGFLRSLRPLLGSGGRAYLTVPAFNWLWSADDVHAGHYRRYTRSTLSAVLRAAGYEVEYTTYFFAALPVPVFARRTVPSLLGLRRPPGAEVTRREHAAGGAAARALGLTFRRELARVAAGRPVPLGSSCLAVARRAD